jgi:hypothetical protein
MAIRINPLVIYLYLPLNDTLSLGNMIERREYLSIDLVNHGSDSNSYEKLCAIATGIRSSLPFSESL